MKNILFVDDEARVLQGLERQLHGMRHEWTMAFADSGPAGLDLMDKTPMDVVVTDMIMPGMDGAQLLSEVSQRHPQCVRIVLSGHADQEGMLRLAGLTHQFLSKPCDSGELRHAINRAFALRELLSSQQLRTLVTRTKTLPVMPALYRQLTEELAKEELSVDRVSEIISKDIGLTTKIFQLVNSAFFGLPRPVNDAREAVIYIGLATIRALVLSLKVFSQFEEKKVDGFSIEALENHCWTTGVLARKLAVLERCDREMQDQCFLAGLVHDVGQLVLASGMPEEYGRVLSEARGLNKSLWETEREHLGATHAAVGGYLIDLWGLSNPVVEAVSLHHCPSPGVARNFSPLLAVHVANALTHDRMQSHADWPGNQLDLDYIEKIGFSTRLEAWRAECYKE
jgi:HD-like signal output (HDOD) protein